MNFDAQKECKGTRMWFQNHKSTEITSHCKISAHFGYPTF